MPDDLPFVPDATLDLVDAGWWLELRCACGRSAAVPHKLLARRHGPRARVPDLPWRGCVARRAGGGRSLRNGWTARPAGRRATLP